MTRSGPRGPHEPPVAPAIRLSSHQIEAIQTVASSLPPEKRELFGERVMARLKLSAAPGSRPSDFMVGVAIEMALTGLPQQQGAA
jgi:hypothetical protein